MGVVWCRCPSSGRKIETSIESTAETLVKMRKMHLSFSVWCPHCRINHQMQATDATVADTSAGTSAGSQAAPLRTLDPAA
jgi:hypothetical protein